ncbi:hypothetical protein ATANTOWER_032280 [Ataeniobius toweri]|uniref:Uncharacterized protein n=1 Tax=Ataeniobius toweri TaxID=208326 RepID=A0ABU7B2X0_9TELE|nr:hypothetical protein [Ataeniobius toweri]
MELKDSCIWIPLLETLTWKTTILRPATLSLSPTDLEHKRTPKPKTLTSRTSFASSSKPPKSLTDPLPDIHSKWITRCLTFTVNKHH